MTEILQTVGMLLLGLALQPGIGPEDAAQILAPLIARLPPEAVGGVGVRFPGQPLEGTRHTLAMAGGPPPPELVLWARGRNPGELAAALAPAADALASVAAPDQSFAMAGPFYDLIPGEAAGLLNLLLLRPPASLSRDELRRIWLVEHGGLALRHNREVGGGGGRSYGQFHTDPEETARAAADWGVAASPFAGAAVSRWPSAEAIREAFQSDAVGDVALADERRFIDHSRSCLGLYSVVCERGLA